MGIDTSKMCISGEETIEVAPGIHFKSRHCPNDEFCKEKAYTRTKDIFVINVNHLYNNS